MKKESGVKKDFLNSSFCISLSIFIFGSLFSIMLYFSFVNKAIFTVVGLQDTAIIVVTGVVFVISLFFGINFLGDIAYNKFFSSRDCALEDMTCVKRNDHLEKCEDCKSKYQHDLKYLHGEKPHPIDDCPDYKKIWG